MMHKNQMTIVLCYCRAVDSDIVVSTVFLNVQSQPASSLSVSANGNGSAYDETQVSYA
jgi:hypothetical protein